jgi:death-on-curing protein
VPVIYLTIDDVIETHSDALTLGNGGLDGIRSQNVLASAVMQPQQSAFEQDAYETIPEKAAAYGYFIAEGQPFIDGNKRTAALSMLMFLDLNGYDLIEGHEELAEILECLGAKTVDQSEFFGWVVNHARPRSAELRLITKARQEDASRG